LFFNLPNPHLGAPACPFTPKVLQAKSGPKFLFLLFSFLDLHLSLLRSLGVHQQWFIDFEHGFDQLKLFNATSCEGLKEKNKKYAFHHPY
jgi:hypothetical protein